MCAELMGFRRGVRGREAQLLGNAQIDVAGLAGGEQCFVAAPNRGDLWLLLGVVAMNEHAAGRRRNEKPHPLRRTKHVLRAAWLIASGLGAVRPEQRSIAPVGAHLQIIEPQLRERIAQFAQRADLRIAAFHIPERLIPLIERSVSIGRPVHSTPPHEFSETLFAPMRPTALDFVYPEVIDRGDEIGADTVPMGAGALK